MLGDVAFWCAIRTHVLRHEIVNREGPCILVVNHVSHHDPILLSVVVRRKVDWMARREFFENAWMSRLMYLIDSFSVDRWKFALPGIREALRRLKQRRLVGIFPEGELMQGETSVLNGGSMKQGAFLIARRAKVPVIPCVILGSPAFDKVRPWLPLKSGRLWVAFGEPIEPNLHIKSNREGRKAMAEETAGVMRELYAELLSKFSVKEEFKQV